MAVLLIATGAFGTGYAFGGDLRRALLLMVGLTALVLGAILFSHSLEYVAAVSIGDELAWAWQMTVQTQTQLRTDVGWRRGCWVLNLLSWSRTAPAQAATIEMAASFDTALS